MAAYQQRVPIRMSWPGGYDPLFSVVGGLTTVLFARV
jgi:hypothetical protein